MREGAQQSRHFARRDKLDRRDHCSKSGWKPFPGKSWPTSEGAYACFGRDQINTVRRLHETGSGQTKGPVERRRQVLARNRAGRPQGDTARHLGVYDEIGSENVTDNSGNDVRNRCILKGQLYAFSAFAHIGLDWRSARHELSVADLPEGDVFWVAGGFDGSVCR